MSWFEKELLSSGPVPLAPTVVVPFTCTDLLAVVEVSLSVLRASLGFSTTLGSLWKGHGTHESHITAIPVDQEEAAGLYLLGQVGGGRSSFMGHRQCAGDWPWGLSGGCCGKSARACVCAEALKIIEVRVYSQVEKHGSHLSSTTHQQGYQPNWLRQLPTLIPVAPGRCCCAGWAVRKGNRDQSALPATYS